MSQLLLVKFSSWNFCVRFNSSSHVYFATVQKKSYLPGEAEAGFVTRISRTCITDANFDTYSEVTLQCHLEGENYNLLQAATLVTASKKVRKAGELSCDGDDGNQYSIVSSVIDGLVCNPGNNEMSPLASRHSQS